uniref:hypothetical protein n=1 Tax=Faecalibacillus intestinalis TaxID=1982626 RepID=UPI00295E8544
YESLYKFIVSIGIALMYLPFFILYIVLKLSNDIIISNKRINSLTKISQKIIKTKQYIYLCIVNNLIFYVFLFIIFLLGIFCIILGIKRWAAVQKSEDYKKELESKKLELENQKLKKEYGLSEQDKRNKVEQEIKHEQNEYGYCDISINEYYEIEQKVAIKIIKDFSKTHDVVNGFKLGNSEYDIVAKGRGFFDKDYIFEIKYLKTNIKKDWFEEIMNKMLEQKENYAKQTNRLPYVKIVIVTEKENFKNVRTFIMQQKKINNLSIDVIEKKKIENYYFK